MTALDKLQGRVDEVAESASADGRPRLFFARSQAFDAHALYGAPWTDTEGLARDWSVAVARRLHLCRDIGARFCWLIPPDAHAVHADELPEGLAFATPSLADRFVERFGDALGVNLVHPREALKAARGPVDIYRRTDSHWTSLGAYAAYRMVMDRVGQGARIVGPHDVRYRWREEVGDLGWAFDPPRLAAAPVAEVIAPRARVVLERFDETRAALKVFEVDDPALPVCLVMRDSFATDMGPFLAESFRRTIMVGADDRFFPEIFYEERPDVVIVERAERALRFGVIDWALTTWREAWPDPGENAEAHRLDLEARRRLAAGDAPGALSAALAAVELESTPDRCFTAGRARLAAGDPAGAADAFSAALEAEPARWAFLLHLGIAQLQLARYAEALALFARACAVAPWHPFGFEHYGFAAMALGDMAAAEPALRTAVRLAPENAGGWVWLVKLLQARDDHGEALDTARRGAAACLNDPTLQALARTLQDADGRAAP